MKMKTIISFIWLLLWVSTPTLSGLYPILNKVSYGYCCKLRLGMANLTPSKDEEDLTSFGENRT